MTPNCWRLDRRAGLLAVTAVFLVFELLLRTKLGSVFYLAAAWAMVHLWTLERLEGGPAAFTGEKILRGFYYAFIIAAAIFAVFAVGNIAWRSVHNDWTFFQLP